MLSPREIHYRVGAAVRGAFPGRHRSVRGSSGFEFRGHASLMDVPDARRLDLRASLLDPFEQWRVRVQSERRAIPVAMVADLSASMGFDGACPKLQVMADFVDSLSWSAWRNADSFSFIGADTQVRREFVLPPSRARGVAADISTALRQWTPEGTSAQGLLDAHRYLGRHRTLVFLLSDFLLPAAQLAQLLDSLSVHHVVPVALWDRRELSLTAQRGLVRLIDPESGRRRLLWWRPAVRARWAERQRAWRDEFLGVLRSRRLEPLVFEDGFDADAVTRYFHG
ncbi:hypothetical protein AACH06_02945 [Ideonella sp. DXS29W]|uniref:DUF58 domain-containing protein n=1 Tax=Ideonella lacteola TaxID=2984193 RepID=A0ABU9BIH5_9BURK